MGAIEIAKTHGYDSRTKIWHSTRQPVSFPEDPTFDTIEWLHQIISDEKVGESLAMVDVITEEQFTYKELKLKFQSVAAGLSALGLQHGDVVLLLSPNSVWFPVAVLAVMSVGAIITTANPLNSSYEIFNQVKDCDASFIITTPSLYNKVRDVQKPKIVIGAQGNSLPPNSVSFSQLLAADPRTAPQVRRSQSHTAALLYSSGTTGVSKGVVISHKCLIAVVLQLHMVLPVEDGLRKRYLVTIPLFHVYGLAVILMAQLLKTNTLVIMPKFEVGLFLRSLEKYRVTDLPLVPPIVIILAKGKEVDNYDLSSVREVTSGAAPLGKDLMIDLRQRFPTWKIRQGFGMTETSGLVTIADNKADDSHFGSTGNLISSMEGRIVHLQTGENLPPYAQGEIWVKGPNNMIGYLKNKRATRECIDVDGWLHTGDLGYFDEVGQLWVVDRLKELIKYKGYQVAPAELEALLLTHTQILDAAVVPYSDKDAGEVPIAFVVRSSNCTLSEEQIKAFIAEKVAPFKKLRRVTFIEKIPKSASGKILRRELVQLGRASL